MKKKKNLAESGQKMCVTEEKGEREKTSRK
jgi:hypothetical protein